MLGSPKRCCLDEPIAVSLEALLLRNYFRPCLESHLVEEDDRVDARPPALGIEVPRPVAHEAEVELSLEVAIEVVLGKKILQ
jgi:hypothetical protein